MYHFYERRRTSKGGYRERYLGRFNSIEEAEDEIYFRFFKQIIPDLKRDDMKEEAQIKGLWQ